MFSLPDNNEILQSRNRCQEDLNSFPLENWRRPPGRPRTTWMKTIQQDLKSNKLSLNEAINVAQNHPLWRLMSAFGECHIRRREGDVY